MNEHYGRIFQWRVALDEYLGAREALRYFIASSMILRRITPLWAKRHISEPAIFADKSERLRWPGMARAGFLMITGKWMKPPIGGIIHEQRIAESKCGHTLLFY